MDNKQTEHTSSVYVVGQWVLRLFCTEVRVSLSEVLSRSRSLCENYDVIKGWAFWGWGGVGDDDGESVYLPDNFARKVKRIRTRAHLFV